jgi:hypothetical protein
MKIPILTLLLAISLVPPIIAADVSGTWKGTMDTPMGAMENTIILKVDGSNLTGTVKTDLFESKIENAKIDGNNISFEITLDFGKLLYAGALQADQLKLAVTGPDGDKISLICKRQ